MKDDFQLIGSFTGLFIIKWTKSTSQTCNKKKKKEDSLRVPDFITSLISVKLVMMFYDLNLKFIIFYMTNK